ncbi:hypothetical protein AB4156_22730 [Cupriavidus sp. 2MCAB6]|uniref:hypothetical protein n=1 Tax=Cupriavidus sp. 2MCAB6 TaxID=3232981 RepID=UPI003F90742E
MPLTYPIPTAGRGARSQRLIVAALVLAAHVLVLAPVPWPARQLLSEPQRRDEAGAKALQWVTVMPSAAPPIPVMPAHAPLAATTRGQPAVGARPAARAEQPVQPPAAATVSAHPTRAAPSGAATVPMLRLEPPASGDAPPVPGAALDNIARSRQRGGASFERAASDAVASPARRLAAGIAAAAPGADLGEGQAGVNRTARVRGAAGTYCLRAKDPSLKVDPFRQELAVPTNCPP